MSRRAVEDVLGRNMTRKIWTGNYEYVLPLSIQDFELNAVLPVVFYMFRWGYRRGKGQFLANFGPDKKAATINRVVDILSKQESFSGFPEEIGKAILGDLYLCFCLENAKHALGRSAQIQRAAPTHFMSSWVDLPVAVANLRFIPEMLVSILSNQDEGEFVQKSYKKSWFAVGKDFESNVLLNVFRKGMKIKESKEGTAGRSSDQFDENESVGIDQLLMIRLAQSLKNAPDKLRGKSEKANISNQKPISENASQVFSEDIRRFIKNYSQVIPRQTLVPMIESCTAIGLTNILTSSVEILLHWAEKGEIQKKDAQHPTPLFVDCSNGQNLQIRRLAEQSFERLRRSIDRFPIVLMCARLLDFQASRDLIIKKKNIQKTPYAKEWLNLLGEILHKNHKQAEPILYNLNEKALSLAEKLQEDTPEISYILENDKEIPNPAWRLAEALCNLMGQNVLWGNLRKFLDSCLMTGKPNGIASKRRAQKRDFFSNKKTQEVRSISLSDNALDFLVHLHLLKSGSNLGTRSIAFREFLKKIQKRYGFYIEMAPPGINISNELLQTNLSFLERRLRDLSLLVGVNDAESLKRLSPRFKLEEA
ncbi:hypothetical protein ACFL35_05350 [Candidatus Riflebacteria bacterium]